MKLAKFTSVCAAILLLAGCDLVKVPDMGSDTDVPDVSIPSTDTDTETPPAQDEDMTADSSAPENNPAPAEDVPEAETDTSNTATDTSTEDGDAPSDADDEETTTNTPAEEEIAETEDTADADTPAVTLQLLNAKVCGVETDQPPTPTVAHVAGATTIEEPMVGTAAVNALAAALPSFPGIVKLEPRNTSETGAVSSGHCGATRIADNWFVTAAHCVDESYEELRLIGEVTSLRSPEAKTAQGQFAVCHGGYQGIANGYANDIALIRISDEQAATLTNVPIAKFGQTALPLSPAAYDGADMAGWGLTRYGGQLSNDLLTTWLDITTIGPAVITVASRNGAGPCIGDSGGPLYVTEADGTKTLVGVLSVVEQNQTTGEFCAGDYNGRYTNLQGFDDWMQSVMTLCETNPETCR